MFNASMADTKLPMDEIDHRSPHRHTDYCFTKSFVSFTAVSGLVEPSFSFSASVFFLVDMSKLEIVFL
jgi:hypothetical protein